MDDPPPPQDRPAAATSDGQEAAPADGAANGGRATDPAASTDPAVPSDPAARSDPVASPAPQVVLVGTGHVFRIQEAIRGAIQALRPDVVFVELDRGRLEALMHRERTGERPAGKAGFVQGRLQRFQEDVAGLYGAEVGSEMVAAVHGARDVGARLVLIDAPGEQTIRRALKELSMRERLRAVGQLIQAGVRRILPARDARQSMDQEIAKYQEDPAAALEELKRQYPTIHRVLIDERDDHMARNIERGMTGAVLGLAVLGDGHVNGIQQRLGGLVAQVYRLPDVREGKLPSPPVGDANDVSFSFDVQW